MKSMYAVSAAARLSMLAGALLSAPGAFAQSSAAMPQAAQPASARYLAATCANCHGTDGHAVPGSGALVLAGMPKQDFLAAIAGFRTGARPSMIMHQLVRGYSDDQMVMLADHFARQPR